MPENQPSFVERVLWRKITKFALVAGRSLIEQALVLFHTLKDPDTPLWARGTILSALAYFIFPLDFIPDFIPVVGYADDLGAIAAAIAAVAFHIKKEHQIKAREISDKWFGPRSSSPSER